MILEELYGVQQEAQDKVDENDAELQAIEAQISAYYTPQQPAGGQSQGQTPNYSGGAFVWPAPGFYLLTSEWNEDPGAPITTEPLISPAAESTVRRWWRRPTARLSFPARAAGAAATALIL